MDQQFYMPLHVANAIRHMGQRIERTERHAATIHEVDANAAHTGGIQLSEFAIADFLGYRHNGAQPIGMRAHRIKHRTIVDAMHARLHDNAVFNAQMDAARTEIAKARASGTGAPAATTCAAEAATIAGSSLLAP